MSSGFILYAIVFLGFFVFTELVKRQFNLVPENTRRVVHLVSSALVSTMPFLISRMEVIVLASLFLALLVLTKLTGLFTSVHGVKRKTVGEMTFPIGAGFAAWWLLPSHAETFTIGFMVLGLSDTAAQMVGERFPIKRARIFGQSKSVGGALAFFVVTFALLAFGLKLNGIEDVTWWRLVLSCMAITLIEFALVFGLDNAVIPTVAAWIYLNLTS